MPDARTRRTLPRLSDPREGPILREFWDTSTLGKPPYAADIKALTAVIGQQGRIIEACNKFVPHPAPRPSPAATTPASRTRSAKAAPLSWPT